MDIHLFNKIAQTLKQQFPKASHEFLMEKTRQMYEAEIQRRSKLSEWEKLKELSEDIIQF